MGVTEGDYVPLIGPDSPLKHIPVALDRKQARLLNGIRLNAQAVASAWERVFTGIAAQSAGDRGRVVVPTVIADAWTMVNAFHLLVRLAESLQAARSPTLEPFQEEFRVARNDHQHIYERLTDPAFKDQPDFGTLHWVVMDGPNSGRKFALWPGAVSGQQLDSMNPHRHSTHRTGIQSVDLDSFNATARLFEAAVATQKFVRRLKEQLSLQRQGLESSAIDPLVTLAFGYESKIGRTGTAESPERG